ncbi:MAG: hypothetical protein IKQ91_03355 [Oscillospiraceae bacterium]|nr:hypothetical protein [Oscillospiraceae bacterium]
MPKTKKAVAEEAVEKVKTVAEEAKATVKAAAETVSEKAEATVEKAKTAAKAVAAKPRRAAAKKTDAAKPNAAKKADKLDAKVVIELPNVSESTDSLIERAKTDWTAKGNALADMKQLTLYINAAEGMVYYVVNDDYLSGNFAI